MVVGRHRFPKLDPEYLHRMIRERAPWFTAEVSKIHWRMAVKFEQRLARSFGSDRCWLAGDAAHMTGPVGGQSMNVGLREAAQLAEILAGNLRGSSSRDALAAYGSQRLNEWQQLLGVGGPHLATVGDVSPWIADRLERIVPCVPASGVHLAALVRQLGLEPKVAPRPSVRPPPQKHA
jgi:2-polyprenyl-6-methoxyphenol hydroxylase-like FAD-dependent oxidoreductase